MIEIESEIDALLKQTEDGIKKVRDSLIPLEKKLKSNPEIREEIKKKEQVIMLLSTQYEDLKNERESGNPGAKKKKSDDVPISQMHSSKK